jgi:hypothetical protein
MGSNTKAGQEAANNAGVSYRRVAGTKSGRRDKPLTTGQGKTKVVPRCLQHPGPWQFLPVNFCIQRHAWVYNDRIVVGCSAEEAQRIKDVLNTDILPNVNKHYRQLAAEHQARQAAEDTERQAIMGEVEKAIRNQK